MGVMKQLKVETPLKSVSDDDSDNSQKHVDLNTEPDFTIEDLVEMYNARK